MTKKIDGVKNIKNWDFENFTAPLISDFGYYLY